MSEIEKSIIKTLAYYEALGKFPLTAVEIFRYLQKENASQTPPNFYQIVSLIKQSPILKKYVQSFNGFFSLADDRDFYWQRIYRQKVSVAKWRKLRRLAFYLKTAPFLRGLVVSGSLTISNTRPDSDLDLLIFIKKGRIWTGRTILSFLLQIIGQRRHDQVVQNKICLNHYIAEGCFEIMLQNLSNAQLYCRLVPLTDYQNYHFFQQVNSSWMKDLLFSPPTDKKNNLRQIKNGVALKMGRFFGRTAEFMLDHTFAPLLERKLAAWQTKRIQTKTHFKPLKESELFLGDQALLFHYPICKNAEVMELFEKKLASLNLN